jgi:antitoxin HigA-1
MAIKLHPSIHVHPGPWLREEIVEPYRQNVKGLAAHFGVSRQALSGLLNGHAALSAEMAIRFEKAFGIKADTLLRMQSAYDLAQARAHEDDIKVGRLERAVA